MRTRAAGRRLLPLSMAVLGWALLLGPVGGCSSAAGPRPARSEIRPTAGSPDSTSGRSSDGTAPAATVVGLDFLYSFENEDSAPYFPISGLAGVAYAPDGTLIFCDQKRGKVFGLDPMRQQWFEFDTPTSRPYAPLDAVVDGFKVLVLDTGGNRVWRFDLNGALLDVLADLDNIDPGYPIQPSAFAVDQDGRMIITDLGRQQVLLLDSFLNLTMRVGDPGSLGDQFHDPMGLAFRSDGGFLVSDQGNRRLCLYGRLGFFEDTVGGVFEVDNPFVAPAGLDTDRRGNVFVADPGNGRIHVLDPRLRPLLAAGAEFSLQGAPLTPVDVAVGPGDLLAVSDPARAAVLVYRILYP